MLSKTMKQKGFTLIETLLVIALISIITAFSFFAFFNIDEEEALQTSETHVKSIISEARSLTLASKNRMQYGVHFTDDAVIRFEGGTYSSSDGNNVVYPLHKKAQIQSVSLSGGGDSIVFNRLTGSTDQSGTITLSTRSDETNTRVITISETGIIE